MNAEIKMRGEDDITADGTDDCSGLVLNYLCSVGPGALTSPDNFCHKLDLASLILISCLARNCYPYVRMFIKTSYTWIVEPSMDGAHCPWARAGPPMIAQLWTKINYYRRPE